MSIGSREKSGYPGAIDPPRQKSEKSLDKWGRTCTDAWIHAGRFAGTSRTVLVDRADLTDYPNSACGSPAVSGLAPCHRCRSSSLRFYEYPTRIPNATTPGTGAARSEKKVSLTSTLINRQQLEEFPTDFDGLQLLRHGRKNHGRDAVGIHGGATLGQIIKQKIRLIPYNEVTLATHIFQSRSVQHLDQSPRIRNYA